MTNRLIRDANEADAEAITAIYAHHVLNGTATYDIDPPTAEETLAKIRRIRGAGWPFIVAELDGEVAGYAYATQFRDRAAYRFACEDSIYVAAARMRRGVGRALVGALLEPASAALHAALGFEEVGRLKAVGFKFGRWLDSLYMQRDVSP